MSDSEKIEIMIATDAADEYYGIRKPMDAIEGFLEKRGRPAMPEVIAKALEGGGWARGQVDHPYWNILSAIKYHFKTSTPKRIKEVNGLIGKIEWPDDMFAAIQEEKE